MKAVEKRYQHWSADGIVWTDWFRSQIIDDDNIEEVERWHKDSADTIFKATHLKSEFRIVDL